MRALPGKMCKRAKNVANPTGISDVFGIYIQTTFGEVYERSTRTEKDFVVQVLLRGVGESPNSERLAKRKRRI